MDEIVVKFKNGVVLITMPN